MSKINIINPDGDYVFNCYGKDVPYGSFFIGKIENYDCKVYCRAFDNIVGFEDNGRILVWGLDVPIEYYREVDVDITIK